ncbi:MAG: 3-hydroxyacyl-CoA dehydrogenase [Bryobacteraceae bacterium]
MSIHRRVSTVLTFFAVLLIAAGTLLFAASGSAPESRPGRLFFLSIGGRGTGGRVASVNDDGSDLKVLVSGQNAGPDGIVVDTATKKIYWTSMGKVKANDGSIESSDLDGGNVTTVVPAGGAWTPKQLKLDAKHGKLYWSDREGMRIMRANLDGSDIETLVETAAGDTAREDARNWCVGIALDVDGGKVYWTQKGSGGNGRIFRANLNIPKGEDAAHRTDIETLFDQLPEPIDMDLDLANRTMYWSDRGDPPRGNNISRAPMDPNKGPQQILVSGLKEGIGMTLDLKDKRMFYTDLGGNVYGANMDGTDAKILLSGQGALTGITWVDAGN